VNQSSNSNDYAEYYLRVKEMAKIKNWSEREMNKYLGDKEAFEKIFK
jgi:hypothetical protein